MSPIIDTFNSKNENCGEYGVEPGGRRDIIPSAQYTISNQTFELNGLSKMKNLYVNYNRNRIRRKLGRGRRGLLVLP